MNPASETAMTDLWLAVQDGTPPTPEILATFTAHVNAGVVDIDMSSHGSQPNMALLFDLYRPTYVAYLYEQAMTEIQTTVLADMTWSAD